MDLSHLQSVNLKPTNRPDNFAVQDIDQALAAVIQSLRSSQQPKTLPVVKLQDNSSVVEVMERILAVLKEAPEVLSTIPKVTLKKNEGRVVDEKKELSGYA